MEFKELINNRKIGKLALSIFFLLRERGLVSLTNQELAYNLGGYCTRSIQNALKLLERQGYIHVQEQRLARDGRRKKRLISLNLSGNMHEVYEVLSREEEHIFIN